VARFYADECFPKPVVDELRKLGYDALTTSDVGQAGRGIIDETVLAFATARGRAVLTINRRHFVHLHRRSADHGGIIACTQVGREFADMAERINQAVQALADLRGLLIRVDRRT